MAIPLIICKANWQRWLLVCLVGLILAPVIILRLFVNPSFFTSYLIGCNLGNSIGEVLCAPSLDIFLGIRQYAPGSTKSQVVTVLGTPRFKECKMNFPGCPPLVTKADEVWFYELPFHRLLFLCFKGEKCTSVGAFRGREDGEYARWKTLQIQEHGIGKTQAELESWLGNCFIANPDFVRCVLMIAGNKSAAESEWKDLYGEFYLSPSTVIGLEMRNGRLLKAQQLTVFY